MNGNAKVSLHDRLNQARAWLAFDVVDPLKDRFRYYPLDPRRLTAAERNDILGTAIRLRRWHRAGSIICAVIAVVAAAMLPLSASGWSGVLAWVIRIAAALMVTCAVAAMATEDEFWADLGFRDLYFRGRLPSQNPAITAFPPARIYLYPPLHLLLFKPRLRAKWIKLPPGLSVDSPRFARRRVLMARELARRMAQSGPVSTGSTPS